MSEQPTTRRLFLVGGTAVAACARINGSIAKTGDRDSVFAAIEQHRVLKASIFNGSDEDPDDEMTDLLEEQLQALGRMEPTTVAGAIALLAYMADEEGYFADANSPLVPTIHSVVAALTKLEAVHV